MKTNGETNACLCGGTMVPKVGMIENTIQEQTIQIENFPYWECLRCKEKEFDLETRVSSLFVQAFRSNWNHAQYREGLIFEKKPNS